MLFFGTGGLRNVDINMKIASLQRSWIKQLYDNSFQEWKLIPLHLMNVTITPTFKFYPSLALSFQVDQFTKFHQIVFQFWSKHLFLLCFYSSVYNIIQIFMV